MKIRHSTSSGSDEIELQMTPMIDIVFQLLIFFVMTFKIVVQEGDFNVKMPKNAPTNELSDEPLPPFTVTLTANPAGQLVSIETTQSAFPVAVPGNRQSTLEAFAGLRKAVQDFVGADTGPDAMRNKVEAEIKADDHLHYVYVIDAISHVSGYVQDTGQGTQVVKLIEKIKFAPPAKAP